MEEAVLELPLSWKRGESIRGMLQFSTYGQGVTTLTVQERKWGAWGLLTKDQYFFLQAGFTPMVIWTNPVLSTDVAAQNF